MASHTGHHHDEPHDLGLSADLPRLLGRRRALQVLGGAGLLAVVGCSSDDSDAASDTTGSTSAGSSTTEAPDCGGATPEETAGPFPGDGSNGPSALQDSGVVRSDIRSSFGGATGVAEGVELRLQLSVFDAVTCRTLPGAAVYVWQCDRDARYSMYDREIVDENYLRGVQGAAADGTVLFTTIFPACYPGRWPHIHFEVYPSLTSITSARNKIATSQLAFPKDICEAVYATAGYEASLRTLQGVSLEQDMVFSDGSAIQLATVGGSAEEGYLASLVVTV
ncbi:MAG: intradiol ring-cleavage dioxygenase [Actinomycetota bacterium]|nr:intradiol ring-cleavage dioxygenase [Actinomycetota bacterium]